MPNTPISGLFESQRHFFHSGATLPFQFRHEALKKLKTCLLKYENEFISSLKSDLRKPELEAYISEFDLVLREIDLALKKLNRWMTPTKVSTPIALQPATSFRVPEPFGVTLIIAPWNYPLDLTLGPLVGAIAAGNCVIIKPSEFARASTSLLYRMLSETFDANYISVVEGEIEETTELLTFPFNLIFFTGSTAVGKVVMTAAAKNLTPVILELGGKNPCIVTEHANVEVAARRIAWGKFFNAGQTCIAPDYILVHEKVKDLLIEHLKLNILKFFGENPQKSPDFGRIIDERHLERLKALLNPGTSEAKVVLGGISDTQDKYLSPTLIDNVTLDSPIMQSEIFGPLLPILTFTDLDSARKTILANPAPLSLYLFTHNQNEIDEILTKVSFGGGCVNDCLLQFSNHHLSFGGVGQSGLDGYHGEHSFNAFSHFKSVCSRRTDIEIQLRYPPYTRSKSTWLRRFLNWG